MKYNKEETDKCKESNKTLGTKPKIIVGINKANSKKYSLLFISLIISPLLIVVLEFLFCLLAK